MSVADAMKGSSIGVVGKLVFAIRAEKSKRVFPGKLVPEPFQFDGALAVAFIPKNRDHFTESTHGVPVAGGGFD